MSEDTDLLLSSTQTVHTSSCPTMGHVENGFALRWANEYGPDSGYAIDSHPYRVYIGTSVEQLRASATKYTRCEVCAPEVPDFEKVRPSSVKIGSGMTRSDLGRESFDGFGIVTTVTHSSDGTLLGFDSGVVVNLEPGEYIRFWHRGSL